MTDDDFDSTSADALTVLTEVMTMKDRVMTKLELRLWKEVVNEFGDEAVARFLAEHTRRSAYAPRHHDAYAMLAPGRQDTTLAFEQLSKAVRSTGPWMAPSFADPAMVGTVLTLGGWVSVCEHFPELDGSFEANAFQKRFDAAYRQANADLMLRRQVESKLHGLHDLSKPAGLLGHTAAPAVPQLAGQVFEMDPIEASAQTSRDRMKA